MRKPIVHYVAHIFLRTALDKKAKETKKWDLKQYFLFFTKNLQAAQTGTFKLLKLIVCGLNFHFNVNGVTKTKLTHSNLQTCYAFTCIPTPFQENSCLINGYCFAPNESNPIDWCYQCLPGVNTSAWTRRQGGVTTT